ncbi:hypothetical protein VTN00DRAFT_7437 [Thermoascus crustaceus]|uniref:uncharacterized protein n=1 Tax=Thermoascus crustaceus TaxID=5088 RepID=UPI0037445FAE
MEPQVENFHHPYSPYDIQLQFMRALYTSIEKGKVAIFESPTGDDEPEWMLEFAKREKSRAVTEKIKELEARLAKVRAEEEKQKEDLLRRPRKKQKFDSSTGGPDLQDESQFELEDYESDGEDGKKSSTVGTSNVEGLSASTLALLERFQGQFSTQKKPGEGEDDDEIKIFYCSRTHSQLTQFAHELRRVTLPPSLPDDLLKPNEPERSAGEDTGLEERVKHLCLGSRKNLCINPKVSALGNATAINERCLDLQQPGVSAEQKCPYLPSRENEELVIEFRDRTLATVKDIEDIGKVGKQLGICPYYASRSVIKHSEIVTLPYPLLLQRAAREALNLSIKNHVVIIDEAHNLMDAISNIHSVTVTLGQLRTALSQLLMYAQKYKNRLKGKNRVYVTQVIRLVSSIANHLQFISETSQSSEGSVLPSDLMAGKGVDQINPHKLSRYLQESKLARKVDGFVENSQREKGKGRMFFAKVQGDVQLKYMLLDPTNHFREIVEDARAVILAGGTMSPMTDYADYLFSYVPPSRFDTFSYGHVIPPENLTARSLVRGILDTEFDFTYETRNSEAMIIDLGRTISALCQVIPDGVVAFFPSYDYLRQVLSKWKETIVSDKGMTILALIEKNKSVFYESQDKPTKTEELLQEYSTAIDSGSGGLLLSVVGGKLSEGINFSDKLGRGVLMVGLPFPNIRSAVWQAKIQHVEQKAYEQSSGSEESRRVRSKAAGRDFYENACMRAVNQCIGRAIRHRNDYASIVMMDKRYDTARVQGKLPAWIRQSLVTGGAMRTAGRTVNDLSNFFRGRAN